MNRQIFGTLIRRADNGWTAFVTAQFHKHYDFHNYMRKVHEGRISVVRMQRAHVRYFCENTQPWIKAHNMCWKYVSVFQHNECAGGVFLCSGTMSVLEVFQCVSAQCVCLKNGKDAVRRIDFWVWTHTILHSSMQVMPWLALCRRTAYANFPRVKHHFNVWGTDCARIQVVLM